MRTLIIRIITNAVGLFLAAYLINGISYSGGWLTLLIAGTILGVLNYFVKPVITFFSIPFILLSFGAFIFVINALLLLLVSWLVPGFYVQTFWAALFVVIFLFLINTVVSWIFDMDNES